MNKYARQTALQSAIAAGLMLFYGWYLTHNLFTTSTDEAYLLSLEAFKWTLKIGGGLMLIAAGICFLGKRIGLLLDCVIAGTCGLIMIICGLIWVTRGRGFDFQDIIVLVFGLAFIRAAWVSWSLFMLPSPADSPAAPAPPEPIHPASIPSDALPTSNEPPPEGYLSALSKEKDEPPTASYE